MPIPSFDSIGDAATFLNTKVFTDAMNNAVVQGTQQYNAHGSRMNLLSESIQGGWANRIMTPDPVEAISTQKMLTGRDSMGIAEAIGLAQVLTKQAQTTPPVTSG